APQGNAAPLPPEAPGGTPSAGTPLGMPAERTPEETARRMGAFARGTRSGRAPQPPRHAGPLDQAPEDDEGNPPA
ncbi:sensor histidine kinase, partial [Streptomyces sp. ISL-11]|nr:sensor histidine kinase [Streptomyces sp. ISL-11]